MRRRKWPAQPKITFLRRNEHETFMRAGVVMPPDIPTPDYPPYPLTEGCGWTVVFTGPLTSTLRDNAPGGDTSWRLCERWIAGLEGGGPVAERRRRQCGL